MCQIWKSTYSCGHKAPTIAQDCCEALKEDGDEVTCDDPQARKIFHSWYERKCERCWKQEIEGLSPAEICRRSLAPKLRGDLWGRKPWYETKAMEIKEKGVDEGVREEEPEEMRKAREEVQRWRLRSDGLFDEEGTGKSRRRI